MKTIGIIGLGKLGLCLALNLEKAGYHIRGVDVSDDYTRSINEKTLKSPEPFVEEYLSHSSNLIASTSIDDVLNEDIALIFVVVATPSLADGGYDHSQIDGLIDRFIQKGNQPTTKHLVINCTTMPGYCDTARERLAPYNYTVSFNPEFIAQGSIIKDQQFPDQVLIGEHDKKAGDLIEEVYTSFCKSDPEICRMSLISAEITKLATNCFLTTKISFANSIGDLATKAGAEPDKILSAIGKDSRIGSKYLNYGFGYGGPCFPRDNRALSKFGEQMDYELLLSKATDQINANHLDFQFHQWMEKYPENEPIVFDYVTYKKGTTILEESQQLGLALKLAQAGRKVVIQDRKEVQEALNQLYPGLFTYTSNDE